MKTEGLESLLGAGSEAPHYPRAGDRWDQLPAFMSKYRTASELWGEGSSYPEDMVMEALEKMKKETSYEDGGMEIQSYFVHVPVSHRVGTVPYTTLSLHRHQGQDKYYVSLWALNPGAKKFVEIERRDFDDMEAATTALGKWSVGIRAEIGVTHTNGEDPSTLDEDEWSEWEARAEKELVADEENSIRDRR